MKKYTHRVVETDNFGGDYPDEKFASPRLSEGAAIEVAKIINSELCDHEHSSRFWKVVKLPYDLEQGFEP